jgi:hypothetical protein
MTDQTSDQMTRPMTNEMGETDYLPDDDPMGVRRRFADILALHEVCAEARCRRARACAVEGAPCIRRCRSAFEHLLPKLRATLRRRLAAVAGELVAGEKAGAGEARRWRGGKAGR